MEAKSNSGSRRGLFSGAEWLTILGTALVVLSAALPWAESAPPAVPAGLPPVYVSPAGRLQAAYEIRLGWLNVGWALVTCGVISAALLLLNSSGGEYPSIRRLRFGLAVCAVAIALLQFQLRLGPALGLVGAGMLAAGAALPGRMNA